MAITPEQKARRNAAARERYANDPEYRARMKARQAAVHRERMADPEYRARRNAANRTYRAKKMEDPAFRQKRARSQRASMERQGGYRKDTVGGIPRPEYQKEYYKNMHINNRHPVKTYFILYGAYVKIGRSSTLTNRMRALRCAMPEEPILFKTIDGDCEYPWHQRWKKAGYHVHGEWFRYEGGLRTAVEAL